MDWLAFAGSIIGGLIGGLFTYLGVRATLKHDDKKRREQELKTAIEKRPRLELIEYKDMKQANIKENSDLNALMLHIENVEIDQSRIKFIYDSKAADDKNLICFEYYFKNTGATEIEDVILVSTLPKDTALLEYSLKDKYISYQLLNYAVWSNKRFIKSGDTVSIKIYYLQNKIISGLISCPCAIYLRDINGRYWHQPLFAPRDETDNSALVSYKDFKDNCDVDTAIKCFRGELPW